MWTETELRRGGVAILLNPYSSVTKIIPWMENLWTGNWMSAQFKHHWSVFVTVNVYAPTAYHAREALFQRLSSVFPLHDGPIILGGDFSCMLNAQLGRSFSVPGDRHDSPALRGLIEQTCVIEVLEEAL